MMVTQKRIFIKCINYGIFVTEKNYFRSPDPLNRPVRKETQSQMKVNLPTQIKINYGTSFFGNFLFENSILTMFKTKTKNRK